MTDPCRRSVIAGGFTLIAGSAITAVGTGAESVGAGADTGSNDGRTDAKGWDEEGRSDEESAREAVGDPDTAASALELSVSVPESVPEPAGRAEFLITVVNCSEVTRSVPIVLEFGCVEDELETPSLAPGESADAYASYAGRRLESGVYEWSVAVDTTCERGTLSVA